MRAPVKNQGRRTTAPSISARLSGHITLDTQPDGSIAARFDGYAVGLGKFSADAMARAGELRNGLPLDIDVYDTASWSAVSALSEKSVANRSAAVDFPDFTRGGWKTNKPLEIVT